ncbi:MAG: TetR/AcrR family transcriptional regulator [Chloroflexota bacterium]
MSTQTDNPERHERILDAAANLIVHYGFDKTTVSDIACEAGISKGAIYLHFDSKDALFEGLLMREVGRYNTRWFELIEADPEGGLFSSLYKNVLIALNESDFMSAIFRRDTRILGSYLRKEDNLFKQMGGGAIRHEFMAMMQSAGAIRQDVDPQVMAHIMNMLAFGLVSMDDIIEPTTIPETDAIIEGIAEMMDRMLTPEDRVAASEAGKAVVRQLRAQVENQVAQTNENNKETDA